MICIWCSREISANVWVGGGIGDGYWRSEFGGHEVRECRLNWDSADLVLVVWTLSLSVRGFVMLGLMMPVCCLKGAVMSVRDASLKLKDVTGRFIECAVKMRSVIGIGFQEVGG